LKAVSDFSQEERHFLADISPDDWVVAIATALLAFFLLGILPRMFW
jgi:hypothetical protein